MNNTTAGKSGFSVLWCTNQCKIGFDEDTCRGLQPAPSTNRKARAASHVQSSKQDDNSNWLGDQLCRCLWRFSNVLIKLWHANWSSLPCSVPVHYKCTSFLQEMVNRSKHTKSGHNLFRKDLWQNLCAFLPLLYVAMYIKCMSASTAQVKHSMLMLIWLQDTQVWGSEFIFKNNWLSKCAIRSIRNSSHGHWLSMLPSFQALHQICEGLQCHRNATYIKNLIYTSPVDSEEDRWGSSNPQAAILAFLSAHVNLCCSWTGCVSRSLAIHLNTWSQLVTNYNFFAEYFSGFVCFPALVRSNLMVRAATRMCDQHTVVWQYSFVLGTITSWRLGMEFFHTLYVQTTWWLIAETGKWAEGDSLVSAKRNDKQEIWKMWKGKTPIWGPKDKK